MVSCVWRIPLCPSFSCVGVCACSVISQLCDPMDCCLPGSSVNGISRQEYWNWLPFPSPGALPNPGIKPASPALAGEFFTSASPLHSYLCTIISAVFKIVGFYLNDLPILNLFLWCWWLKQESRAREKNGFLLLWARVHEHLAFNHQPNFVKVVFFFYSWCAHLQFIDWSNSIGGEWEIWRKVE